VGSEMCIRDSPGLRGLSVTLTGSADFVAGGVGAVSQINATKAV
jgi:hypothetical protein